MAANDVVTCVRCTCPECERERFLLWKLIEDRIFEAAHARGVNTRANEVYQKAWVHRPIKAKTGY